MSRLCRFGAAFVIAAVMTLHVAEPVEAAGPYDGTYRGTTKLVQNNGPRGGGSTSCSGNSDGVPSTRRVVNNQIKMPWGTNEYEVQVGADGTVSGEVAVGAFQMTNTGKITGTSMIVNFGHRYCGYRFEGIKGG